MSANTVEETVQEDTPSTTLAQRSVDQAGSPQLCDAAVPVPASALVMIHVRFHPDARVWQIAECPPSLNNDEWFEVLSSRVGDKYETRAGGRGFFRISRMELDALKTLKSH
jgi:hypothetical protein